jgi:hypothetical protein
LKNIKKNSDFLKFNHSLTNGKDKAKNNFSFMNENSMKEEEAIPKKRRDLRNSF